MLEHDENEIYLYGVIGEDFFEDGVTAKDFLKALKGIKGDLDLFINSPGGDIDHGLAIQNQLSRFRADGRKVSVHVDALAASMGSGIAMAADSVSMASNSLMMIHAPWTFAGGNAEDFRKAADLLDKAAGTLKVAYQAKSGKTSEEMDQIFSEEVWYNAEEAVAAGFADSIAGESLTDITVNAKKLGFRNCPVELQSTKIAAFSAVPTRKEEVNMVADFAPDQEIYRARQRIVRKLAGL